MSEETGLGSSSSVREGLIDTQYDDLTNDTSQDDDPDVTVSEWN